MRTTAKQIVWPVRGVEEATAYHDAAPDAARTYAAPFSLNVCTRGPIENRERGGSRPGLSSVPQGTFARDFHPSVQIPSVAKGAAPSGNILTERYRDRIFAASGADWFCSRVSDASDWDYGADRDDIVRACAGNLALAGARGETITAIMPIDDGTLYVATEHTLWRMQGDPANGEMHLVSREYGVVGPKAWCAANQRLFFVSHRGFVSLTYGEMPRYQSGGLPHFPTNADTILGFDAKENCVWSFSSGGVFMIDAGMGTTETAFWPMFMPMPDAVGTADGSIALHYDGGWKRFDDSVACESHSSCAFGPFRISSDDATDGFLAELHITLAEQGADMTASLYAAHSAERAAKLAQGGDGGISFDFAAGWNAVWRPRLRGAWCVLVLECAGGKWAFEAVRAICRHTGRLRP